MQIQDKNNLLRFRKIWRFKMKKVFVLLSCCLSFSAFAVPAYLTGKYLESDVVIEKLKAQGFEVLGVGVNNSDPAHKVISVTNKKLRSLAKKRAFAGNVNVFVNSSEEKITVSNPNYFQRAYFQKNLTQKDASALEFVRNQLMEALSLEKQNVDVVDSEELEEYQYAFAMEYYNDQVTVAEGQTQTLLANIKKNAEDRLVFVMEVKKGTYLVGVDLRASSFIDVIESTNKAAFLPYTVVIENNSAKMMHGRFYIALSNPKLRMWTFRKIMSTPGDIEDEYISLFK
jgi:hypothetical protein